MDSFFVYMILKITSWRFIWFSFTYWFLIIYLILLRYIWKHQVSLSLPFLHLLFLINSSHTRSSSTVSVESTALFHHLCTQHLHKPFYVESQLVSLLSFFIYSSLHIWLILLRFSANHVTPLKCPLSPSLLNYRL